MTKSLQNPSSEVSQGREADWGEEKPREKNTSQNLMK
jgi:hypothetical protein